MSIADKLLQAKQDLDDVYEAGKKSEYDLFWDAFQNYGKRNDYTYAFANSAWNDETFTPKYDIRPIENASNMFRSTRISDLEGVLQRCGVVLDTSKTKNLNNAFNSSYLTIIPTIDMSSLRESTNSNMVFRASVHTIRKMISNENTPWSAAAFQYATGLVNLTIGGVIGQNGFDVHYSEKLSKASITSIINALSTNTSGLSITLSKTAVNTAFGINVDDTNTYPEGSEYCNLRHSKDNWTINYI